MSSSFKVQTPPHAYGSAILCTSSPCHHPVMQLLYNLRNSILARKKRSRTNSGAADSPQSILFSLQDHRENMSDQTTSTAIPAIRAANTVCNKSAYQRFSLADSLLKASFKTIGTSGPVMNVAGDLHMHSGYDVTGPSTDESFKRSLSIKMICQCFQASSVFHHHQIP